MYDLAIIGAGIAGLSAGIYAERAKLNYIVLESDGYGGGQIVSASTVQNYPGVPDVSGFELAEKIKNHFESIGGKVSIGNVKRIEDNGSFKTVICEDRSIKAKAVIAATGASPKTIDVDGISKLSGISYCAVCDGIFYENKNVVVIGGGDTAVEDALYLSKICSSVTLIHRRNKFRAAPCGVDRLKTEKNIRILTPYEPIKVFGEKRVESVVLKNAETNSECILSADGLFIAVGSCPRTQYLGSLGISDKNGYIVADENGVTRIDGIFAAGDIRKKSLRQAITAAADGANAVNSAVNYLSK
ncbi:MAG: NAD(P)/FAD-dependent oxidoreductase [Acutalibacteraceae bacterium]